MEPAGTSPTRGGCASNPQKKASAEMTPAKPKTTSLVFELIREKETPGTQRYTSELDRDKQIVKALYVNKAADKKLGNPERVQVTITPLP